jgi:hypothetical protein
VGVNVDDHAAGQAYAASPFRNATSATSATSASGSDRLRHASRILTV